MELAWRFLLFLRLFRFDLVAVFLTSSGRRMAHHTTTNELTAQKINRAIMLTADSPVLIKAVAKLAKPPRA